MSTSSRTTNASFHLSDPEVGMLTFVNILFSIVGSLGNIFVCLAFVSCPQIRNSVSVFILSLAWSDLLVCLISQPMFVASLVRNYQQQLVVNVFEDVRKGLTWISLLASAGNLLGVTVQRYVAITRPFMYENNQALKLCTNFSVSLVWLFAICLGTATRFHKKAMLVGQLYVFVIVLCLILPLYCRVLQIAKQQQRHIQASFPLADDSHSDSHIQAERHRAHHKTERTALRTVGIISAAFVFGWFPLLVFPFVYRSSSQNRKLLLDVFQWINTLALCSSAINPIIYSWTDRRYRGSIQMVYKKWAAKREVSAVRTTTLKKTDHRLRYIV